MNLKLMMISPQPLSDLGGVPIHLIHLATAMVKLGVDVEMIMPKYGSFKNSTFSFNLTSISLNNRLKTLRTIEYSFKAYKYLLKSKNNFDAVHGSQWSMFYPCINKQALGLPLLTKFHGTYLFGTIYKFLLNKKHAMIHDIPQILMTPLYTYIESKIAEKSDGLIFINKSLKKEVEAFVYRKLCRDVRIIYNGVDTKKFRPMNHNCRDKYRMSADDKILLFVGRLEPLKGPHKLISVARNLMRDYPNLKVVIAGDGDPVYIRFLLKMAKPKNRFIFMGRVSHSKLPEIYNLADVFISPSPYSGGNTLLEAMASGIPIVAVKGLGFEELIKHGENGFIVTDSDTEYGLERCLRTILDNEVLLDTIGRNARIFAEKNLSWEKTAKETLDFIISIVNGSVR
ncbi:MAG: glycosyltransferase family 4 protein [Candidatus Bathyarchaeia archaeon]